MKNAFIGSPVERREDLRFLRGRGEFLDDLKPDGLVYAVILRSSVAHGRIVAIDTAAALKIPGVHAVITAKDMPPTPPIVPMRLQPLPEFKPFEQPVIAHDKVRYVGEPMAVVIADSVAIGEDALEVIEVEIESLPAVADWHVAHADKSLLFEAAGTNRSLTFNAVRGDADAAFKNAPYVRRETLRTGRHYGLTMEPRGVMAEWDAAKGRLTVSGAAKVPFFNRRILAKQIGLAEDSIEMIENDVGGGFGARGEFYPEDFLIPFAARHLNRPVKWTEDRRENLMAMNHAREAEVDVEIACAARRHHHRAARPRPCRHGRLYAHQRRGRRAQHRAVHGGAVSHPGRQARRVAVDDQQDAGRHLSWTGTFRDRLLPRAAVRSSSRQDLRHRPGRVPPQEPDRAGGDAVPDRHHLAVRARGCLRQRRLPPDARSLPEGSRAGPTRRSCRAQLVDGRYHGLAVGCFIEGGAAGPKEMARLEINDDGSISVYMGSSAVGQGVETVFAQIAADALEIPMDRIRWVHPRLDRLCERRLRRLSFALDRDGRLGLARRRQQLQGGAQ